jgi:predicted RNA binding protein YcfA (HicA-like mRNA interferase family)
MSRLKVISAKEFIKILIFLGFEKTRQNGSHVFFRNKDGRTVTIPLHGNKTLPRPLICEILKEINISIEEYNNLVN